MLERETALQSRAKELAEAVVDSIMAVHTSTNLAIDMLAELNKRVNNMPPEIDPWVQTNIATLQSFADLLHIDYPLKAPIPPIKKLRLNKR